MTDSWMLYKTVRVYAGGTGQASRILSVVSVMRYILLANAGACLSPKDEFAQEHERIRHMYRVGNEANL